MLSGREKNKRVYPVPYVANTRSTPIPLPGADKGTTGGQGPGQNGWESLNGVDEGPVQAINNRGPLQRVAEEVAKAEAKRVQCWPDSGIAMPANKPNLDAAFARGLDMTRALEAGSYSNVIFPSEDDKPTQQTRKIHSFGLSEDFERVSIDNDDDQNDFGGIASVEETLDRMDREEIDEPGSVDADENKYGPGNYPDDRTPEFYHDLFTETKQSFTWIIPGICIGPHPINPEDFSAFKTAGIKAIVSVLDKPLDPKHVRGFHYFFAPTVKGFSSNLGMICRFIDTQAGLGNPVFIHSLDSKGRAATVLAAYFVFKNWLTADEAIAWVRLNYNKAAIGKAQEDAVLKFSLES